MTRPFGLELISVALYNIDMTVTSSENGGAVTFFIEGRIDTTTAPEFEKEIIEKASAYDSVVLDFAKTEYISSAGLRVLLSLYKIMTKKGGLKIVNVSDMIMEVFEVTGFKEIFSLG